MSIADGVTGDPVPDMARVYDYWLGGPRAYRCDRELADRIEAVCAAWPGCPSPRELAARDRAYVLRAVSSAAHSGIRQVIDISTGFPGRYKSPWPGIPSLGPVCEAARGIRAAYVRGNPESFSAVRGMLNGTGSVAVAADPCDPAQALSSAALLEAVDLNRPVCLVASRTVQFLDADDAADVLTGWVGALAPGSRLVATTGHCGDQVLWNQIQALCPAAQNHTAIDMKLWFAAAGLRLDGAGIEVARHWGPEPLEAPVLACVLAGVGTKR